MKFWKKHLILVFLVLPIMCSLAIADVNGVTVSKNLFARATNLPTKNGGSPLDISARVTPEKLFERTKKKGSFSTKYDVVQRTMLFLVKADGTVDSSAKVSEKKYTIARKYLKVNADGKLEIVEAMLSPEGLVMYSWKKTMGIDGGEELMCDAGDPSVLLPPQLKGFLETTRKKGTGKKYLERSVKKGDKWEGNGGEHEIVSFFRNEKTSHKMTRVKSTASINEDEKDGISGQNVVLSDIDLDSGETGYSYQLSRAYAPISTIKDQVPAIGNYCPPDVVGAFSEIEIIMIPK